MVRSTEKKSFFGQLHCLRGARLFSSFPQWYKAYGEGEWSVTTYILKKREKEKDAGVYMHIFISHKAQESR